MALHGLRLSRQPFLPLVVPSVVALLFALIPIPAAAASIDDAAICYRESNPDAALRVCTRAIQSGTLDDPKLAMTFYNRAGAHLAKGAFSSAIQDYEQALRLKPNDAMAFYNRGIAYMAMGLQARAIEDFDRTIRIKPDDANAFNNRGNAYATMGDFERAIQDYDHALRLNRDHADAFNNRGNARAARGDYEGAIQDYDQAVRLRPRDASAFYNRAGAYKAKGDILRSIQDYDETVRLNPRSKAFYGRGAARFDAGEFIAAASDFAQAFRLDRTNSYAMLRYYVARARAGITDDAMLADSSRSMPPSWPRQIVDYYMGLADISAVLNAARHADQATYRQQECEAYFFIGEKLLMEGRPDAAMGMLRRALESGAVRTPSYESAKAELAGLAR